ncbi:unnamed protein product, partial [Closterium sp. NIES-54]
SSSSISRRLYRRSSFASGLFGEAALVGVLVVEILEVLNSCGSLVARRLLPQQLCEWVIQRGHSGWGTGAGGTGQQRQQRQQETLSPQQLREWVSQRRVPGSAEATSLGLHLPSFTTNLVSNAVLQDQFVTMTTPGGELVAICTDSRTSVHLATSTRRPGSGLYTLTSESAQVVAFGQLAASCSCRLLTHVSLLWNHRLGHPSLPRMRGMHSRLLVSVLPRSLPPPSHSLAPPCLPCVEGRQRAAPHSSSFPPTTAPLQTLHMDVWGSARVHGQDHERNFLLVVDNYTRYTTVFPLQSKADFRDVLIPWIRIVCRQLSARLKQNLQILRLHSDTGSEFSPCLLEEFCVKRRS